MNGRQLKTRAYAIWVETRDCILTIAGVGTIFLSFPITDRLGFMEGGIAAAVGIAVLHSVWDGITQRARALAVIETITLMTKDGGFSAELNVTYRDERTDIHLKTEEQP